jgi:nucleoside 2-deoxyribosyltransferase
MKIFCAYAFTGEDLEVITRRMKSVVNTLNANGHDAYCNRFDPIVDEIQAKDDIKAIFARAFEVLKERDAVVAIVASPHKSIGQIMEIGVAMSQGKPIYLFEHTSASGSTYLPKLASATYSWTKIDDLVTQLQQI